RAPRRGHPPPHARGGGGVPGRRPGGEAGRRSAGRAGGGGGTPGRGGGVRVARDGSGRRGRGLEPRPLSPEGRHPRRDPVPRPGGGLPSSPRGPPAGGLGAGSPPP